MGLEEAFLSPNLQVWGTPLNSKLLITGSLGIDPKLVEIKSNYPSFKMLVKENENEEDILERIGNKRRRLQDIFGKEFETDTDKMLTSLEGEKHYTKGNVKHSTASLSVSGNKNTAVDNAVKRGIKTSSQPAVEEAESRSEKSDGELEEKWKDCLITEQNPLSPPGHRSTVLI